MIVIPVYRPPSKSIDVFMNHMLEIIAQFQHVPTCIVGDFNEDVSITSKTCCCTILRLQGFKQMINKPTHDSGTIIDHVYVSQTLNTMQTDIMDCYYSDHDCLLCLKTVIDIYHILMKQWYIYIYIYDEYDIVHPNLCKILTKMKKYSNI